MAPVDNSSLPTTDNGAPVKPAKGFSSLVLSWFGSGYVSRAPGTVGSLAALPPGALIHWYGGDIGLVTAALVVFAVGWYFAAKHLRGHPYIKDPQWIVIDEVAGVWLALAVVPLHLLSYLGAFVLFRFFDIVKPWPVSWADRHVGGALGIMLDDLLAGMYAAGIAFVLTMALPADWTRFQ